MSDIIGDVAIDTEKQLPPLTCSADEIRSLLGVMEKEVLPLTEKGVSAGNKVFGAAILSPDFSKVITAATNAEMECPIFHGEVKCIVDWSKQCPAAERGSVAQSSVFLATHEPCCMCISSILWAGFHKVYYFFPYTATFAQGIPHDINTMHELWGVPTYRKRNKYLVSASILDLVEKLEDSDPAKEELQATVERLVKAYDRLSEKYHTEKVNNTDNSLVLG